MVNPVYHSCMKHVQIDLYFVREKVITNEIQGCYISMKDQIVNVLTKPLTQLQIHNLRDKLTNFPLDSLT